MSRVKKKIIIALSIVLVLIGGIGAFAWYTFNSLLSEVTVEEGEVEQHDLMANENLSDDVLNFALFGLDCRSTDYTGCRTDATMIISYNKDVNEVTVTSVPRDTYVDITGYGLDKFNHAYAYGGPELAIQTMNRGFDLDIENYVTVDFWIVEDIIDALGGVQINVLPEEVETLNSYIQNLNVNSDDASVESFLQTGGLQVLSGRQAVAYMRIRYVGDGDFERMERQRTVMEATLNNLNNLSLTSMIDMVNNMLPDVRTNFGSSEIISLLTSVVTKGFPEMNELQVPSKELGMDATIGGVYYFVPNTLLDNVRLFHETIYPNSTYEPSDVLRELSEKISGAVY